MVAEKGRNIFHSPETGDGKFEHTAGWEKSRAEDADGGKGNNQRMDQAAREKDSSSTITENNPPPEGSGEGMAAAPGELQQRVMELEKEKEEITNRMLRLQADFENFRRRARAEKEELFSAANFDLLQKLLPVIDNMDRALLAAQKGSGGIIEGLEMIKKHFLDILLKEGVAPIESCGKPFDPNFHDAVFREECSEYPPGTVVEELQKGYMFNDRILRASMVKVSAE